MVCPKPAGSKEMIQLYEILLMAPGVLGARFSGAGFRGCCLAIVESDRLVCRFGEFRRRSLSKKNAEKFGDGNVQRAP